MSLVDGDAAYSTYDRNVGDGGTTHYGHDNRRK